MSAPTPAERAVDHLRHLVARGLDQDVAAVAALCGYTANGSDDDATVAAIARAVLAEVTS